MPKGTGRPKSGKAASGNKAIDQRLQQVRVQTAKQGVNPLLTRTIAKLQQAKKPKTPKK